MKVLVILLIVGILLFVVLMVWGSGKTVEQSRQDDSKTKAKHFNPDSDQHSLLAAFNGMFGGFSPTLKASSLHPEVTTFNLDSRSSYIVAIAPDEKHKLRQAKFLIQPSKACAHIRYEASDRNADENLRVQDSRDDTDTKRPFTLTILEGGGKLTVEREDMAKASSCKVALQ